MSINGKRDNFALDDFFAVADQYGIKRAREILAQVHDAVSRWQHYAQQAGVDAEDQGDWRDEPDKYAANIR